MRWQIYVYPLMVMALLSGCTMMEERVITPTQTLMPPAAPEPDTKKTPPPSRQEMKRRFEPDQEAEATAVQSVVIWAQKYEQLSQRNNELREQNTKLSLENARLDRDHEKLKTELEQTQKELAEANDFLQQMHQELSEWKSDVLGFRDEIRQSQKVQAEALSKILSVLGAEPIGKPDTPSSESDN